MLWEGLLDLPEVKRFFLIAGACLLLAASLILSNRHFMTPNQASVDFSQVGPLTPITAAQLNQLVKESSAKLTIVNLWATWCGPCVEEFPYFLDVYREFESAGVKLVFVSADFMSERDAVIQFLAHQGVTFETYLKAEKDQSFVAGVHPEWSGALPATLFYGPNGQLFEFLPRPLTHAELVEKVKLHLKKT